MGPQSMQTCQVRFEGYKHGLQANNIPFDSDLIKTADFNKKTIEKAMMELMKLKSPPTGIFAFKNYIALDVIRFLKSKFPQQLHAIDITGFGNLPSLKYLDHKPKASVEEDSLEMGKQAAKLLFQMINEEMNMESEKPQNIQIPCKLVVHK